MLTPLSRERGGAGSPAFLLPRLPIMVHRDALPVNLDSIFGPSYDTARKSAH